MARWEMKPHKVEGEKSDMVERVAKAMAADLIESDAPHYPFEQRKDEWVSATRAAIEAMREPTDGMTAAGRRVFDECHADGFDTPRCKNGVHTWMSMIDAALGESE